LAQPTGAPVDGATPSAELWGDPAEGRFPGLVTDDAGAGSLAASYPSGPGEHMLNVNVVATSYGGADPRPREIGPDSFAELAVPGVVVTQTLYGDGDITCPDHWAQDLSLPVGRVRYQPSDDHIEITVNLDGAWPNTEYFVEVNTDTCCRTWMSGLGDGELYEGFPYGTYEGVSPYTTDSVTFSEDGTCTMYGADGTPLAGAFSVDETTLTVGHPICAWRVEGQPPATPQASYTWEWDGTRLTMTSDDDNCRPRVRLFAELTPVG
jgi:hypothetical protein